MKNVKLHPMVSVAIFIVLALGAAWTAWVMATPSMQLLKSGIKTEATVVDVVAVNQTEFDGFAPVVTFVDHAGIKHRIQCKIATGNPVWRVGDQLTIVYPRDRPQDFRTTHWWDLWGTAAIPGAVSAVFLLTSASSLLSWMFRRRDPVSIDAG